MTTRCILSAAICLTLCAPLALAAEVERLGDLTAIRIEGPKLIPADRVREALLRDIEAQTASSPSAPLTDFLNTLQRRLLVGYESSGFPRAKVFVDPDAAGKSIVIRVEEGLRYRAGPVRVLGAKLADPKLIEAALTEKIPGEVSPAEINWTKQTISIPTWKMPDDPKLSLWELDKPAPLDEDYQQQLRARVLESLAKQGLYWAQVKVETALGDHLTAEPVVTLQSEGPRGLLDELQINGLKLNTPQDVTKFLELEKGTPIDLAKLRQIREKLWDTGRFLRHDVTANVAKGHPGRVNLVIDVAEHPKAGSLTSVDRSPDSPDARMLQFAASLRKAVDGGEAMVATYDFGRHHVKVVFQNGRGIIVRVRREAAGAAAAAPQTAPSTPPGAILGWAPEPLDLTWVSTPDRVDVFSTIATRRYFTGKSEFQVRVNIDCLPETDPTVSRTAVFNVGAGFRSVNDTHAPGVVLECSLAPVFFIDLARPGGEGGSSQTVETQDGITTLTRGNVAVRTRADTGKLVAIRYAQGGAEACLTTSPTAFDDELASVAKEAPATNSHDAKRPISSAVEFLAAWYSRCPVYELDANVMRRVAGEAALAKLLAKRVLAPLDEAMSRTDEGETFSLPADPKFLRASVDSNPLSLLRAGLFVWDELFPYGSWTWTLGHEGTLVISGGTSTARDELRRLMSSDEIGPVGCLAISHAMRSFNPGLSRSVAKIGLERLDAAEFAKDFHVLFENDRAGAKVLRNTLAGVSELSEQEMTDLCSLLPASATEPLRFVWKLGRDHPKKPIGELLAVSQRDWWEGTLRKAVKEELRKLDRGD